MPIAFLRSENSHKTPGISNDEFTRYLEVLTKLYHYTQNELGTSRAKALFAFAFAGTVFESLAIVNDEYLFDPPAMQRQLQACKGLEEKRNQYRLVMQRILFELYFYVGENQTRKYAAKLFKATPEIHLSVDTVLQFASDGPKQQSVLQKTQNLLRAFFSSSTKTNTNRILLQVEDELLAKYNHLKEVFLSLREPLFVVDGDYKILYTNDQVEVLLGQPKYALHGKPIDSVLTLIDNDQKITAKTFVPLHDDHQRAYAGERLMLQTATIPNTFVNVTTTLINQSRTSGIAAIVSVVPIEHNQTLQSRQIDVVSITAHELKSPLTSMRGYLAMLEEDLQNKLTHDEHLFLTRIALATNQIIILIEDLLAFARIENKTLFLQKQPSQLTDLIKKTIEDVHANAESRKITITCNKPSEALPKINIDAVRVIEVLTNLLTNAINYSNVGNKVTVSTFQDDGYLVVEVSDHGVGIPEESIPKLFTKFYQAPTDKPREVKGTGLGLYIAKEIITAHGGTIWVHSKVGEGSTFAFRLPLVDTPIKAVSHEVPVVAPSHRYFHSGDTSLAPLTN